MLTIRAEQMKAFRPAAEAAFERRVAAYLRGEHAAEVVLLPAGEDGVDEREVKDLDDETFLKMVRAGIARARAYGLTWESSITAFVVLLFTVAPNFDSHPLIRRVLLDGQSEPDACFEQLWEQTTDDNWEAAQERYDAAAWGLRLGEGDVGADET
jgi:hypothetical protein